MWYIFEKRTIIHSIKYWCTDYILYINKVYHEIILKASYRTIYKRRQRFLPLMMYAPQLLWQFLCNPRPNIQRPRVWQLQMDCVVNVNTLISAVHSIRHNNIWSQRGCSHWEINEGIVPNYMKVTLWCFSTIDDNIYLISVGWENDSNPNRCEEFSLVTTNKHKNTKTFSVKTIRK